MAGREGEEVKYYEEVKTKRLGRRQSDICKGHDEWRWEKKVTYLTECPW